MGSATIEVATITHRDGHYVCHSLLSVLGATLQFLLLQLVLIFPVSQQWYQSCMVREMGVKLMGRQGMIWLNVFYVRIKFEEWKKKKNKTALQTLRKCFLSFRAVVLAQLFVKLHHEPHTKHFFWYGIFFQLIGSLPQFMARLLRGGGRGGLCMRINEAPYSSAAAAEMCVESLRLTQKSSFTSQCSDLF